MDIFKKIATLMHCVPVIRGHVLKNQRRIFIYYHEFCEKGMASTISFFSPITETYVIIILYFCFIESSFKILVL
jgi:hypothetical protein